jgi:hypothetical protein
MTIGGGTFRGHLMKSNEMDELAVEPEDRTQLGNAEAEGTGRDVLEHRLDVNGRAGDHLQNLTGRRFPLTSLR